MNCNKIIHFIRILNKIWWTFSDTTKPYYYTSLLDKLFSLLNMLTMLNVSLYLYITYFWHNKLKSRVPCPKTRSEGSVVLVELGRWVEVGWGLVGGLKILDRPPNKNQNIFSRPKLYPTSSSITLRWGWRHRMGVYMPGHRWTALSRPKQAPSKRSGFLRGHKPSSILPQNTGYKCSIDTSYWGYWLIILRILAPGISSLRSPLYIWCHG